MLCTLYVHYLQSKYWSLSLCYCMFLRGRVKCQKVNHFKWNWQLVHLLPPVVRSVTGMTDDGVLVDILVDDVRQVLYTLTTLSSLSVFYLGRTFAQLVKYSSLLL